MRSMTAGLARQASVAAVLALLAVAAISSGVNVDRRQKTASVDVDRPIIVPSVVHVAAPEPAPSLPQAAVAPVKTTPIRHACASGPCRRLAAVSKPQTPQPSPEAAPEPIKVAFAAPEPEPPPPPSLRKRLFAPVGFLRENVARLISWL